MGLAQVSNPQPKPYPFLERARLIKPKHWVRQSFGPSGLELPTSEPISHKTNDDYRPNKSQNVQLGSPSVNCRTSSKPLVHIMQSIPCTNTCIAQATLKACLLTTRIWTRNQVSKNRQLGTPQYYKPIFVVLPCTISLTLQ